jgi:hypothetical protein
MSIPSRTTVGDHVEGIERDLRDRLLGVEPEGNFEEAVSFTYDLARRLANAWVSFCDGSYERAAGVRADRSAAIRRAKRPWRGHPMCRSALVRAEGLD